MKKIYLKIFIFLILLVIPFISAWKHIEKITVEEIKEMSKFKIEGISKDLPGEVDLNNVRADVDFSDKMDEISRYSSFLSIQPSVIRHIISLKNNVSTNISYSETLDGEVIDDNLNFILSCNNNEYIANGNYEEIRRGLKLNDQAGNNGIDYVENIRKDCIYSARGGFKQDFAHSIYVHNFEMPRGSISIKIEPDLFSKISIILGWCVLWFGFYILFREGPWRIFKKR